MRHNMNNDDPMVAKVYTQSWVGQTHICNNLDQQELLSASHMNGETKAQHDNRACSRSWNGKVGLKVSFPKASLKAGCGVLIF